MKTARFILGFLLAPLGIPLVLLVGFSVLEIFRVPGFTENVFQWWLLCNLFAVPIAYAVTLVGAGPGVWWLKRTGRFRCLPTIGLGLVLGALTIGILLRGWTGEEDRAGLFIWLVLGMSCGAVSAAGFWWIAEGCRR